MVECDRHRLTLIARDYMEPDEEARGALRPARGRVGGVGLHDRQERLGVVEVAPALQQRPDPPSGYSGIDFRPGGEHDAEGLVALVGPGLLFDTIEAVVSTTISLVEE